MDEIHLHVGVPAGLMTETHVNIFGHTVHARTEWEDELSIPFPDMPISPKKSIERCERLKDALDVAIAQLKARLKCHGT